MFRSPQNSALLAAFVILALGCGDQGPPPDRVWTPADHAQPPGRQVDPSRMPSRPPERVSPEEQRARAARALWTVSCARCHGSDGRGGAEAPPGVPDLTLASWQTTRTDEQLAISIRNGRGMMPAFDSLDDQAISALVGLVRSFVGPSTRTPPESTDARTDDP